MRSGWLVVCGLCGCGPTDPGRDGDPDRPGAAATDPRLAKIVSATATPGPELVHHADLQVILDAEAAVRIDCEAADVANELHVLHSPAALAHDVSVYGLLADTPYDCVVTVPSSGEASTVSFTTEPLPDDLPTLAVASPGAPWGAWTLMMQALTDAPAFRKRVLIIDPEGRVRWFYRVPTGRSPASRSPSGATATSCSAAGRTTRRAS